MQYLQNKRFTHIITLLALVLFVPLFITRGVGKLDFWWWMSLNIACLTAIAAALDLGWRNALTNDLKKQILQKIGIGILSALGLYVVFYMGNMASRLIFPFAANNIENVYAFKAGAAPMRIALLMAFIIGPGEELFWRGFLQRRFQVERGPFQGFLLATLLYTGVHIASGNVMLVLAAGVCGLFWGFLYLRTGSLLLNVISHTVWDMAIFLFFPMI
ncbi:MAG: type II CAAX endopeptidase family protein [Thermodesulfobacteriota bacterium]